MCQAITRVSLTEKLWCNMSPVLPCPICKVLKSLRKLFSYVHTALLTVVTLIPGHVLAQICIMSCLV